MGEMYLEGNGYCPLVCDAMQFNR